MSRCSLSSIITGFSHCLFVSEWCFYALKCFVFISYVEREKEGGEEKQGSPSERKSLENETTWHGPHLSVFHFTSKQTKDTCISIHGEGGELRMFGESLTSGPKVKVCPSSQRARGGRERNTFVRCLEKCLFVVIKCPRVNARWWKK